MSLAKVFLLIGLVLVASSAGAADAQRVQYFPSPNPKLPFSAAVQVGDIIYLSGQIGLDPENKTPQDLRTQAKAAMDNIAHALSLAGATMDSVFKCTVMLDDMSQWAAFNEVYVTYFKPGRLPARSAFGADGLALGAALEVECLALAPKK